ncbi:hypothetical protein [Roseateles asaccharophilus]|uniref:Phage tail protein n=1 Tax=Roseateles asaccharophilus TaxID=582607 RepID=A0ABU2A3L2_9BURK|nr:hypothetical protein [Roseateles asaccharophilus]MDR7331769.1 hypothetical protein [Roseateles asaccharophilus]
MTGNLRIISTNEADEAVLDSSDFLAALPVGNLQLQGRARVARTSNAAGLKLIEGEWPNPRVLTACVLQGHNLTSSATWRLQCWSGVGQTGDLTYDSGTQRALRRIGWGLFGFGLVPWGSTVFTDWERAFSVLWFAAIAARSWRITLADAGNPAGYLQAKRLLMGSYFEPAVNAEYGLELTWREDTTQQRTQASTLRSDAGPQYRRLAGNLSHLDAIERARFMELCRKVGMRREIFVSVFPGTGSTQERDYALLGKFTVMPDGAHGNPASWQNNFTIEES